MLRNLQERARSQAGFTLVELLVVILIIGILAAIALPNFLGQSAKANDSSAKSNARNAVAAVESCFTDAQSYSNCNTANTTNSQIISGAGLQVGTGENQVSVTSTATTYAITAYSKSGNQFQVTYDPTASPASKFPCTRTVTNGGCPAPSGGVSSWN